MILGLPLLASAWLVSHTPSKLGGFGMSDITDVNGDIMQIYATQPLCEHFQVVLGRGLYPLNQPLHLVAIADPEHDQDSEADKYGRGCLDCGGLPCCRDVVSRSNWRWLNESRIPGKSDNFCVPKGIRKSGPEVKDEAGLTATEWATYNGCDHELYPDGYCQPWCTSLSGPSEGCDACTDATGGFAGPVNPTLCDTNTALHDAGDCNFAFEAVALTHPPVDCRTFEYRVQHPSRSPEWEYATPMYMVVIHGNDNDVVASSEYPGITDDLEIWMRMHPHDCNDQVLTDGAFWTPERTQTTQACPGNVAKDGDFYHAITTLRYDDGTYEYALNQDDGADTQSSFTNAATGQGEFCAGHLSAPDAECSPKLYAGDWDGVDPEGTEFVPSDETGFAGWCRFHGCRKAAMPVPAPPSHSGSPNSPQAITCEFGDLIASANFPVTAFVHNSAENNECVSQEYVLFGKVVGTPSLTTGTLDDEEPNFCCTMQAHLEWFAPTPIPPPTPGPPTTPAPPFVPTDPPPRTGTGGSSGGSGSGGMGMSAGSPCMVPGGGQGTYDSCGVCNGNNACQSGASNLVGSWYTTFLVILAVCVTFS